MYYVILAKNKNEELFVLSHCFSDIPNWTDFREPDKFPAAKFETIKEAKLQVQLAQIHFKIFNLNIELG